MHCQKCGNEITNIRFCSICGSSAGIAPPRQKKSSYFLAVFIVLLIASISVAVYQDSNQLPVPPGLTFTPEQQQQALKIYYRDFIKVMASINTEWDNFDIISIELQTGQRSKDNAFAAYGALQKRLNAKQIASLKVPAELNESHRSLLEDTKNCLQSALLFRFHAIDAMQEFIYDPKPIKMYAVKQHLDNGDAMIIGAIEKLKKVSTELQVDLTQ